MSGRMKILLSCLFALSVAIPAFAAGNLERIRGTWDCNGEESLKLNPDVSNSLKEPEARRQALLLFESISFKVDAEKNKLAMSVGDEQKINHFMVNSDDGKFLVITTSDEEKINFEFKDDNTLISHGAEMRMLFKRRQAALPGPLVPAGPADQAGPAATDAPADQAGPAATDAPAGQAGPVVPANQVAPASKTGQADTPAQTNQSAQNDQVVQNNQAGPSNQAGQSGAGAAADSKGEDATQAGAVVPADKTAPADETGPTGQTGKADKTDKGGKSGKPDKGGKTDKTGKVVKEGAAPVKK